MNIMICSAGRRVRLIEYFKEELLKTNGKILAVDCDPSAPALYHADKFEIVPRVDHPDYIKHIKKLCIKYKINAVLSLIDPELTLLASYKSEFEKDDIHVIVSAKEMVDICFDKYLTYQFLQKHEIPSIPTFLNIDEVIEKVNSGEIKFPLIIKPRNGSASLGIRKVYSINELEEFKVKSQEMIVQPFISGEEFGVDCYIDLLTKQPTNIFMKRKITMRAGETDKSIAFKDPELKRIIQKLINVLNPLGPIDIDCFKIEDRYIISEINPRFGGGYPHAHESGQNFIKNIINNIKGLPNVLNEGNYKEGTRMVKFDQVIII